MRRWHIRNSATPPRPGRRPLPRPAARRDWYRIVNNADTGNAKIYLYDEVGYWGTTAQDLVDELKAITAPRIDLHINSPGGEVFDGLAIYNTLRAHPAAVTTYIDGLAASAASFIALAGDRVVCARNAVMMIHDAAGLCWGNAADMGQMRDVLDKLSDNIADIYTQRAGGSLVEWRERMRAETWYTGAEAVTAGLADESTDPEPDEDPDAPDGMSARWDLSIFTFAGREKAPAPDLPAAPRSGAGAGRGGPPLVDLDAVRQAFAPGGPVPGLADVVLSPDEYMLPRLAVQRLAGPAATACPSHSTPIHEGTWDASTHVGRLPSPMTLAVAKRMYGYYDPDKVEDGKIVKAGCKLPHHEVSEDGTPGAAVAAGVRNALSRLPQSDIPEAEHAAIRTHLQGHLDDLDDLDDHAELDDLADAWTQLTGPLLVPAASTVDDALARLREACKC
jgi:ATP-dependent protease ClpP protease subunit